MGDWLSKLVGSGKPRANDPALIALRAAMHAHTKISLNMTTAARPVSVITTIEQVRDHDLAIHQPTIDRQIQQLAVGESLELSFVHGTKYYTGATKCTGRIKLATIGPDGKPTTLFAYTLAFPSALKAVERRSAERAASSVRLSEAVQLYSSSMPAPVAGVLVEITMSGARVVVKTDTVTIASGSEIYMKTKMPDPVGLLDELVRVERVETHASTGEQTVRLSFLRRIDGLEALIRSAKAA